MNSIEAANFLGVPENKVKRWLRQGVIPHHHESGELYFVKAELVAWAKRVKIPLASQKKNSKTQNPLQECLNRGGLHLGLTGNNRDDILKNAVAKLNLPPNVNREELLKLLIQREEIVSTGTGGGIAIPHPQQSSRLDLEEPILACFLLEEPIDYGALDGQPVFCLFMLLAKEAPVHLKLLSRLAHFLKRPEFIAFLKEKPDQEKLCAYFDEGGK